MKVAEASVLALVEALEQAMEMELDAALAKVLVMATDEEMASQLATELGEGLVWVAPLVLASVQGWVRVMVKASEAPMYCDP